MVSTSSRNVMPALGTLLVAVCLFAPPCTAGGVSGVGRILADTEIHPNPPSRQNPELGGRWISWNEVSSGLNRVMFDHRDTIGKGNAYGYELFAGFDACYWGGDLQGPAAVFTDIGRALVIRPPGTPEFIWNLPLNFSRRFMFPWKNFDSNDLWVVWQERTGRRYIVRAANLNDPAPITEEIDLDDQPLPEDPRDTVPWASWPRWLRDSDEVYWSTVVDDEQQMMRWRPSTRVAEQITFTPGNKVDMNPYWHGTARRLIGGRGDTGLIIDVDTGLEQLFDPPQFANLEQPGQIQGFEILTLPNGFVVAVGTALDVTDAGKYPPHTWQSALPSGMFLRNLDTGEQIVLRDEGVSSTEQELAIGEGGLLEIWYTEGPTAGPGEEKALALRRMEIELEPSVSE
jgi:hypothetical protein